MKLVTIFNNILNEEFKNNVTEEPSLSQTDKKVLSFILGDTLNEGDGDKILNRLISLINSGKKNLITAAVITTLLASSTFNQALAQAPQNVKAKIEQVISPNSGKELNSSGIKINNSVYADSFSNNFSSGSYELSSSEVISQLENLKNFLSKSNNNDYEIKITASESQVPNQGGLKIGELAAKRAKVLTQIVKTYLNDNGITNINVVPQIRVGNVKWDGSNKDDQKYVKDQFVQMDVVGISNTPVKKGFTKTGQQATAENNYVDSVEQLKGSGEVNLSPGWIPDRLVIYKDGKIAYDTGYFVDKAIGSQYKQWNFTPKHIANLTKMLISSPNTDATNTNTIKRFNSFEGLINALLKDKKFNYSADPRGEVRDGVRELKRMWDEGQREFMFYSAKSGKINFKISPNEKGELKIFSPVNDTQYSYQGFQIINGSKVSLEKNK